MKVSLGPYPKRCSKRKVSIKIDKWDCYDVAHTLSIIIVPLLTKYRSLRSGHPCGISEERWDTILVKMIYAFQKIAEDKEVIEHTKEVKNGMRLFIKYFHHLWY